MGDYRKLRVTTRVQAVTLRLYEVTSHWPGHEQLGLSSQVRRAAISIGCNVAEGCGRNRPNELAQHVRIALGSANELEYSTDLARKPGYVAEATANELQAEISAIKGMSLV